MEASKKKKLYMSLAKIISETNGLSVMDTMELLHFSMERQKEDELTHLAKEFQDLLYAYQQGKCQIDELLDHPVSHCLFDFLKKFPLKYCEDHIHLTGSLSPEFVYEEIQEILAGPNAKQIIEQLKLVYGRDEIKIESEQDVADLICLKEGEKFAEYLKILYLPKLILTSREAHMKAAYHMARKLYHHYNIGSLRLKFTLSRASTDTKDQIPGASLVSEEDVLLGLYDGFKSFQNEFPLFNFVLSPCFRKEGWFYDQENFSSKKDHFNHQVDNMIQILKKHPYLKDHLNEVDTVGDEKELYRKAHFEEMKHGFRKLQYYGFKIRSHHGETWKTLKKGVQSVDNAMNIWHIDNLEHGLSLGINPNYYYHRIYERIISNNKDSKTIAPESHDAQELEDMTWFDSGIKEKLLNGEPLNNDEETSFIKTKFHHAREVEHYQHDVLNRMIDKGVSLVALPSSNMKLTDSFPDYKDHPFSWWEKKGVKLGVGTDNYVTLNTNYIKEMLILLYSDPEDLKITKLLMVTTKEKRRPYISHLLWEMRKMICD